MPRSSTSLTAARAAWHPLALEERVVALHAAYLSDGLLDDPHEHPRLHADHDHSHHQRLQRCAAGMPAAAFSPGEDAARVLAAGMAGLLAQVERTLP
ncbi:hypothetical protein ACFRCW_41355 [Streptomyces sp. NPDC056653]|uniref:hypothetical protein n=1 Tax=Streptomyces sp. NPDC056653 TaxID=3345894 RepID=UPI0036981230